LIVIDDGTPPATQLCAALNMAFAKSSGEILGWLEPGDILHTNGLYVIGSVFPTHSEEIRGAFLVALIADGGSNDRDAWERRTYERGRLGLLRHSKFFPQTETRNLQASPVNVTFRCFGPGYGFA
jgi:hypothetical protein